MFQVTHLWEEKGMHKEIANRNETPSAQHVVLFPAADLNANYSFVRSCVSFFVVVIGIQLLFDAGIWIFKSFSREVGIHNCVQTCAVADEVFGCEIWWSLVPILDVQNHCVHSLPQ